MAADKHMSLMAGGCIAGASSVSLKAAPLAPVAVGYRLMAVAVDKDVVAAAKARSADAVTVMTYLVFLYISGMLYFS